MKKILLITALCIFSAPALAQDVNEDGYVELPGNAYYKPGGDNDNVYIYRRYGRDDLYRHLINPYARPRNNHNEASVNDVISICGNTDRASERRRCRKDVMDLDKDRAELYRKYN